MNLEVDLTVACAFKSVLKMYAILLFCFKDLWNVYNECENFAVLKGHTGAIMELHFNIDGRYSTDSRCKDICFAQKENLIFSTIQTYLIINVYRLHISIDHLIRTLFDKFSCLINR